MGWCLTISSAWVFFGHSCFLPPVIMSWLNVFSQHTHSFLKIITLILWNLIADPVVWPGVALTVAIIFSGLGLCLSICVINIHYHRTTRPVPKWIKRVVVGKIGSVLCRMRNHDEETQNDMYEVSHSYSCCSSYILVPTKISIRKQNQCFFEVLMMPQFLKFKVNLGC